MSDDMVLSVSTYAGAIVMKTIVTILVTLSVLAGVAAPASALDAKTFWDQQERNHN